MAGVWGSLALYSYKYFKAMLLCIGNGSSDFRHITSLVPMTSATYAALWGTKCDREVNSAMKTVFLHLRSN